MNRQEFINAIAEKGNYTKKDAEVCLDTVLGVMEDTFEKNEDIRLVGFGSWNVKTRAAREIANPRNRDEKIMVPESKTVNFKPGKTLKDKLNK